MIVVRFVHYSLLDTGVPAPTEIQFLDISPSSFIVAWRAPNVRLLGYRVTVTPKNQYASPKEMNVAPDSTQVLVPGLMVISLVLRLFRPTTTNQSLALASVVCFQVATPYDVHVYALKGSESSAPLTGKCTTADSKSLLSNTQSHYRPFIICSCPIKVNCYWLHRYNPTSQSPSLGCKA